jgi:thioesterase domain-containing protein/acyl carrier protein
MTSRSPEEFYELLAKEQVTVLNQTPSAFRQLIQAEESVGQKELALRYVILGGEALEMQSLRLWFERHGDQKPRLVNMYGVTETTVHVTYRPLSKGDLHSASVIGVPIPDLQIYILDTQRQPAPIGVPGEMCVSGAGLARGYLHRPELTAERFVPDHLTGRPGSRLYKTGDLARFLPGRDIEYLGRIDHQVKIRGFRIELGEIESVLRSHSGVREAVVVVREEREKQLVAYVVPNQVRPLTTAELRGFLGRRLPEFMLPSRFEFLQSLPLTPNGKVDRRALPVPGESRPGTGQASLAPRTELEEKLAQIWCGVLHLDEVGVHDNFFDLGGHSLLATKLMARVEKAFGKTLPLAALFQAPTVQHLAELLSGQRKLEAISGIVPIQPAGSRPPFFCLGAGPLFRPLARHLDPDQPFLGLGLGKEDLQNLPVPFKLEDMAAVLVRKVREIQPAGPYFLGGWCLDGVLAYETARQLMTQDETVGLLVLFDAQNPNPSPNGLNSKDSGWRQLLRRMKRYFTNLRRVTMADRLDYLRDTLQTRMMLLKYVTWGFACELLLNATGDIRGLPRLFGGIEYFAVSHYRPKPYPGRVLVVQAATPLEALDSDPGMGWGEVVPGGLEVHSAAGGHRDMFKEPYVAALAGKLGAYLVEAREAFTASRSAALL